VEQERFEREVERHGQRLEAERGVVPPLDSVEERTEEEDRPSLRKLIDELAWEASGDPRSDRGAAIRDELLRRWPRRAAAEACCYPGDCAARAGGGGAAALRADMAAAVLEHVEALRREIVDYSVASAEVERLAGDFAGVTLAPSYEAAAKRNKFGASIKDRLDQIEAAVRGGELQ
jgi:hypothetical protein